MAVISGTNKTFRSIWSKAIPYLLVLPVVAYYALFWVRPVLSTVFESFQDAAGQFTFQNYVMVFTDPDFIPALRNTTIIVVFSVTLEFLAALFLALLINRKFVGSSFFLFVSSLAWPARCSISLTLVFASSMRPSSSASRASCASVARLT